MIGALREACRLPLGWSCFKNYCMDLLAWFIRPKQPIFFERVIGHAGNSDQGSTRSDSTYKDTVCYLSTTE